jgi:hypothetical protein
LTIWLIFNLVLAVAAVLLWLKIRHESQWLQEQLQDFNDVDETTRDDDDDDELSNNHSILQPLKYE